MLINFLIGISGNLPRADNAVSKNKTDFEIGSSLVTLSRSEGSVAPGVEMLRCGSA